MSGGLGGGGILAVGDYVYQSEYEVIELLGGGNSGEVYRISHQRHGDNRVIKLFVPFYQLRQARFDEPSRSEHTRLIIETARKSPYQKREYKFLSKIDHPFVLKVNNDARPKPYPSSCSATSPKPDLRARLAVPAR